MFAALRKLFFWEFPRGSWQYDIICALLLAFIFLTPREWFRDQPRIPNTTSIAVLPSEHGGNVVMVDPGLVVDIPEDQRIAKLSEILTNRTGRNVTVTRIQPLFDETEEELRGYVVFTRR